MAKKEFEFEGSGFKGAKFEKKGMQERNLENLLETLSKKETQKSIEALAKIEPKDWSAMATVSNTLKEFLELGGTSVMFETMASSITDTLQLQIESILSPITNEINQAMTDILTPFINDILTPFINDLNSFLSENDTGTGVGGIIGGVIGAFTPLGPIVGGIVGAIVGALIEYVFTADITGAGNFNAMTWEEQKADIIAFLQRFPDATVADYYEWITGTGYYYETFGTPPDYSTYNPPDNPEHGAQQ
jgi:hypothetical protein